MPSRSRCRRTCRRRPSTGPRSSSPSASGRSAARCADPEELAAAVRAIRDARRPLVVAGGGVHHSEAEDALKEFADLTRIPVASTQAGKGSLTWDHPADVGGVGHTGTATACELARTADLVIGVGTRYTDFTTASGTLFTAQGVRFLNLNIASFDGHKLSGQPLIADARTALESLTEALALHGHRAEPAYVTEYTDDKERWEYRVDAAYEAEDPDIRPTQPQVLGLLDEIVTGDDILINAAGSLPGDLHKLWRARSRDQYHVEYGYSCMGYEIPAAIGVRLAAPDRPVWALVGDGTYLMMPTEIVTAVQEGIAIKVVILQNHGYASIGGLSESVGGERFAHRLPPPVRGRHVHGAPAARRPGRQRGQPGHAGPAREDRARPAGRPRRGPGRRHSHLCLRGDPNGRHSVGRASGAGLVGCSCGRDRDPTVGGQGP